MYSRPIENHGMPLNSYACIFTERKKKQFDCTYGTRNEVFYKYMK